MSDKLLLIERALFEYKVEERGDFMYLKGLLSRSDQKNLNGRIYPHALLEREMKNYQILINEQRSCGELDHPENSVVELSSVSHLITKLWWQGKEVFGEMRILNTPKGKTAQELIKGGVKLGISSRAVGSLKESPEGSVVQDDATWISFDLVSEASCQGAYLTLKESFNPLDTKLVLENGTRENLFSKEYRINRILNKLICGQGCADFCEVK